MSQPIAAPIPSNGGSFLHWIGTKNPFYAISAALVLTGLWISFGNEPKELEIGLIMAGLTGYTLLLAVTAYGLIRYLKLWDDGRTVLLLIVLFFLAISVTFDHVLMVNPTLGANCYSLGLLMAIAISEVLLRGIHLRLPLLYRLPYYLVLAVFFLYPIFVRMLSVPREPLREPGLWALFGFSTAAGLAYLTLLPAVRRGPSYVRDNGSPWPWPIYPWSLFVFLAIAVPGRAVFMCWSLHPMEHYDYDRLAFGPFFLVPFGFALTILLLEMGLSWSRPLAIRFALAFPVLLVGLAMIGHSPGDPVYGALRTLTLPMGKYSAFESVRKEPDAVYGAVLDLFTHRLGGDPLYLTLLAAAFFYAYAMLRRVPQATFGLTAVLVARAFMDTDSLRTGWLSPPQSWPLLTAAGLQLAVGMRLRSVWHQFFGFVCLASVVALTVPLFEANAGQVRAGIFVHLVVLALLSLGALNSDKAGLAMRRLGALSVLALSLAVLQGWVKIPDTFLPSAPIVYPLIMGIALVLYGQLLQHSYSLVVATLILGCWVFLHGWAVYRAIRRMYRGLDYIVPGLAFFVIAVLVSLAKSGVLKRWVESRGGLPDWLRPTPTIEPPIPQALPVEPNDQLANEGDRPASSS